MATPGDDLAPEDHARQHVGFIDRDDTLFCRVRAAPNALCAMRSIWRRVYSLVSHARSSAPLPFAALVRPGVCAKYAPPVSSRTTRMSKPSPTMSARSGRGGRQRLVDLARAEVAVEIEVLPQRQQRGPLGLLDLAATTPTWARQPTRTGSPGCLRTILRVAVGQGPPVAIDGDPADVSGTVGPAKSELTPGRVDHLDGFGHDLRPNPVARQHRYRQTSS